MPEPTVTRTRQKIEGALNSQTTDEQDMMLALAMTSYSFLLPYNKPTTLKAFADVISINYQSAQASEVAKSLRSIGK